MPLICFASPKGGVGKTTLAANVAGTIARSGARVIALDLDPQNSLRLHFGIPLTDSSAFAAVLPQRPDWRSALRPSASGVNLLPFGPTDMPGAMQLAAALAQHPGLLEDPVRQILAQPGVWLVVDTPPGPSPWLASLLPLTSLLVTVLLVDATSISLIPTLDSGATYGPAGMRQSVEQGFVLNQFDPRTRLGGPIADAASRHLGGRLFGTVYRDEHVAEAVAAQKLLADYVPGAKATSDIDAIARAIMNRVAAAEPEPAAPSRGHARWLRR